MQVQEELAKAEFEGFDANETVRVIMSGNQEPRSVEITEAAREENSAEVISIPAPKHGCSSWVEQMHLHALAPSVTCMHSRAFE